MMQLAFRRLDQQVALPRYREDSSSRQGVAAVAG
jgi:hypothetical protein